MSDTEHQACGMSFKPPAGSSYVMVGAFIYADANGIVQITFNTDPDQADDNRKCGVERWDEEEVGPVVRVAIPLPLNAIRGKRP